MMNSLVNKLVRGDILKTEAVINVFRSVDRGNFCQTSLAYIDSPQLIGFGATISAPHMHALALEYIYPFLKKSGTRALDIGSGSGYLSTGDGGFVIGIDHIPELVKQSIENVKKDSRESLLTSKKLTLLTYDGRLGYPEGAPYHVIHVGASVTKLTDIITDQLATGGILLIPIGNLPWQLFKVIIKDEQGKLHVKESFPVAYVPLTSKDEQLNLPVF